MRHVFGKLKKIEGLPESFVVQLLNESLEVRRFSSVKKEFMARSEKASLGGCSFRVMLCEGYPRVVMWACEHTRRSWSH
jgi:hypothetical protein